MLRSLFLVALMPLTARADVIVIDPTGGPGAPLLKAAITAAQPGDILLLKQGDYSSATQVVTGKGLTLVAEAGHDVHLPALWVQEVPATQTTVPRGLEVGPPDGVATALQVQGHSVFPYMEGRAWVEDCMVVGAGEPLFESPTPSAASVSMHESVVVRSRMQGGVGADSTVAFDATSGGVGLFVGGDRSVVIDVTASGGVGGGGSFDLFVHPDGGPGLYAYTVSAWVLGGAFTGGDEGLAVPAITHGGPGILVTDSPDVFLRGPLLVPGGVTGEGFPGSPITQYFSHVVTWPAPVRLLEISSPVREFGTANLTASGEPGDLVLVLASLEMSVLMHGGLQGALVVPASPATLSFVLGSLDGSGVLAANFLLPALPPGLDGVTVFTQLVTADVQGEVTLGGASALTWISAAF